ncbi:hypothetical protein [Thermogemmatispora tikiterensis]|uniref:Uncharacterized protein n=1 Tax=Thermogemmatispora tikiterensis TaxID=1825093 RepID=A0A328VP29_9CHLR|nr:hypothetical protein [Thermogemmatispora tikiterensis]RAQ96894.1 hypothetical protein A4R35_15255 [Thermogemmatispora tikiterensis]
MMPMAGGPPGADDRPRAFRITDQQAGGLSGMMGRRGVPLGIPLPFLVTGICLAALAGLLSPFVLPEALINRGLPHVLALVHTMTLGWLTMTILGASQQLTPVIAVTPLHIKALTPVVYPLYLAGVLVLLGGFWFFLPGLLVLGGSLVIVAVLCYVAILATTLLQASKRPLTVFYLFAALLYLGLVVALGLTAALNFIYGFLGLGALLVLPIHVTLGVAGWLTNMLVGVSYTLVRLFALVHDHNDRLGWVVLGLLNLGIIGLALGLLGQASWLLLAGAMLLTLSVWLFGWDYWLMLRRRRRRPLDVTQYHSSAALIWLLAAATALPILIAIGSALPAWPVALVFCLLVGWSGQSIVGYLYKIVPFLVWHSRYGPLVGHQKVPLMRELIHERLAWASFWLLNGGLVLLLPAVFLVWDGLLRLGAVLIGASLVGAAANVLGVVRHLEWKLSTLLS